MDDNQDQEKFFPTGASVFFVLLMLLGVLIWLGIYALMLYRS